VKAARKACRGSAPALNARRIPKDALHPMDSRRCLGLFHRGKYDTAVSLWHEAVEVVVRHASIMPSLASSQCARHLSPAPAAGHRRFARSDPRVNRHSIIRSVNPPRKLTRNRLSSKPLIGKPIDEIDWFTVGRRSNPPKGANSDVATPVHRLAPRATPCCSGRRYRSGTTQVTLPSVDYGRTLLSDRYRQPGSSVRTHEPNPRKTHKTRADREEHRAPAWLQIPAPRQEAPRVSGLGFPQPEDRLVRPRLFLAPAQWVPLLLCSEVEYTILAGKI